MSIENYKYVSKYSDSEVNEESIYEALNFAWKNTPSKNNFMPYKVFVLGPKFKTEKEIIYWKCLSNQSRANGKLITDIEELKKYEEITFPIGRPNYKNIINAPYLLIFTQRVEDQPNDYQKSKVKKGYIFEQMATSGKKYETARIVANIEIGMFSAIFSDTCLRKGIDISHTLCFPTDLASWSEPEFNFLTSSPILLMTAGIGEIYRRTLHEESWDLKPNFNRIINIMDK